MSRKEYIYKSLKLDTIVKSQALRTDATYLLAVAEKVDVCSSFYTDEIQDICDFLVKQRWEENITIDDLIVAYDKHLS